MTSTIKCKFPIKRREPSAVGETVVEKLRPVQPATPRTSRSARLLALAHHVERMIEAGELRDYAEAARALGITRARATQIANMLLLSAEIQERLLVGEEPIPARLLRSIVREADWGTQRTRAGDGDRTGAALA